MDPVKKYFTTDVAEEISMRRLIAKSSSDWELYWTFTQGGVPIDLTSVNSITFCYGDDYITENIVGTVYDADQGIVKIVFTQANTNVNLVGKDQGEYDFDLSVADTLTNTVQLQAYGKLFLLERAGTASATLPTIGVTELTNCALSPYSISIDDSGKTFIWNGACDFTFNLPEYTNPTASIGWNVRIINRTIFRVIIRADGTDRIDDSSAGGVIKSVAADNINHNPWSSIHVMVAGNSAGSAWIHAVEGRRTWSTA